MRRAGPLGEPASASSPRWRTPTHLLRTSTAARPAWLPPGGGLPPRMGRRVGVPVHGALTGTPSSGIAQAVSEGDALGGARVLDGRLATPARRTVPGRNQALCGLSEAPTRD